MVVTPTSLLSCLISGAFWTVLAWGMIRNNFVWKSAGKYLHIFLTAIVVRMLLPIEAGFSIMNFDGRMQTGLKRWLAPEIKVGAYGVTLGEILLFLWMSGVIILLLIHAAQYSRFLHKIERCPGYFKRDIDAVLDRINREFGRSCKFKVLLVPGIQAPAIFGLVRPKILMPETDYTDEELYYILKHEALHYYHHDMPIKILCEFLCIVYWWDPAVFLLQKLIVRALEIRVDCALTSGFCEEEKIRYLECIVKSMKAGVQKNNSLTQPAGGDYLITFAAMKGDTMKQRFFCIWENRWQKEGKKRADMPGGKIMKKSTALKSLLRSPVKTLLTFLLIASASFALFSRVTDYTVTMRETENAKSLYHAVATLDNEVPDIPIEMETVESPDMYEATGYCFVYEMEDKPWLTKEQQQEFSSLPGVTLADTRYMTAGLVEDYKRMVGEGQFGGFFMFEGTYQGYEDGESVLENHVQLKFDDVKVIACEGGPEIGDSFTMESAPLGEMYYARSPYTRSFYDSLKKGTRCLVVADNTGYQVEGSSGIYFRPQAFGEGALRVLDGEPDNYLETESFARQKGWADAINHNVWAYEIVYTSDMRAIPRFNEQRLVVVEGRSLTSEDKDACVVSADFLKEHGLSIGDSIHIQLGNKLYHGDASAITETENWNSVLDAERIPEYVKSAELTIIGAYADGKGEYVYASSPNTIYVPSDLLPVEVPDDYEPDSNEFSVFVKDAEDIEAFCEAAEQFAKKVGMNLTILDRGWMDVKDSLGMGAFSSFLTTVLYVAGAALALYLAVYLYIGRNKKAYAIMRTLGVPAKAAGNSVAFPFVAVSALAISVGGITGLYYAQGTAAKTLLRIADSAPEGYVPNARLSVYVVILCLISELLFVSLSAYFFLRSMKKTPPLELLQEGAARAIAEAKTEPAVAESFVPVKLDMKKLSKVRDWIPQGDYGPVRHVAAYIWRHMRRGIGKTAVSLLLAVVLASGIGTLVLARITYQDAFHQLGVKGRASDLIFTSVTELSKSNLVKEFYCSDSFGVRVQGAEFDIPMTISNDLARNMGDNCTIEFAKGYDLSNFEGTAQLCLMGKELAQKLGVSPGDEIGLMSDMMYCMLKKNDTVKDSVSQGYKTYKVIGVAETEDSNVSNGIFTGIRSDLTRLFSYDFTVDHCEFVLADNERLDDLEELLKKMKDASVRYSPNTSFHLDTGGLTNIERVRTLLESLFPIAVAAAAMIGLFGPLLVILQSAQEAAYMRILGVTKKRARCMLIFEQIVLCTAGIILVAGGLALYSPRLFTRSVETLIFCWTLYLLGCVCGACAASVQVTRHRVLELLQVRE